MFDEDLRLKILARLAAGICDCPSFSRNILKRLELKTPTRKSKVEEDSMAQ